MKTEVKIPLIIVAAVLVLALIGFSAKKAFSAGDLDQGQSNYEPGVPPWLRKDASTRSSGHGPSANQSTTAPPQPGTTPANGG